MIEASRKARDLITGGTELMNPINIPARLNGYDIIAVATVFIDAGRPEEHETVVLGHDPSRRSSKWVTALYDARQETPPREWYWGHYFEDATNATKDFLVRTRLASVIRHQADLKLVEQRTGSDD